MQELNLGRQLLKPYTVRLLKIQLKSLAKRKYRESAHIAVKNGTTWRIYRYFEIIYKLFTSQTLDRVRTVVLCARTQRNKLNTLCSAIRRKPVDLTFLTGTPLTIRRLTRNIGRLEMAPSPARFVAKTHRVSLSSDSTLKSAKAWSVILVDSESG